MKCTRHNWKTHREPHKKSDYYYSVSICRDCGSEQRTRVAYMTKEDIKNYELLGYDLRW